MPMNRGHSAGIQTAVLAVATYATVALFPAAAAVLGQDLELTLPQTNIYDADPAQLWNRLHAVLFIRAAPDGQCYGADELDPLLWPHSRFLLTGESHDRAVELLDEFLANEGEKLVRDPLRRAVLQRDLWAVFDWLANPTAIYGYRHDSITPEQSAIQIRIAQIISRLALTEDEIQSLPDNYAAAVDTRAFPAQHDPQNSSTAYLPADLFQPDGPWVLLGEHMRPAAPVHARFVQGRSAFFVYLNLPEGRTATVAYLERLSEFPHPLMPQSADRKPRFVSRNLPRFNPQLPQFPAGTQVALVREMMLIDDRGQVRPTGIIELVQLRVYRDVPPGDPERPEGFDDISSKQDFYEFRMTRADLFSGNRGGLHAVGADERELVRLNQLPDDPFESAPYRENGRRILQSCSGCHSRGPGIHSVEAYRRSFISLPVPPLLKVQTREEQEQAAMRQKWDSYSWGLLQGLVSTLEARDTE
jgi:hypothetical protein